MRLVSQYKFIITFKNGFDSDYAKKYCTNNSLDFMYFPTPVEIDSGCGWCVGFSTKTILNEIKNKFEYEQCYEKEKEIWKKM